MEVERYMKGLHNTGKKLVELFFRKKSFQGNEEVHNSVNTNIEMNNLLLNNISTLALNHLDFIIVLSREGEVVTVDNNKMQGIFGMNFCNLRDFQRIISSEDYSELEKAFLNTLKGNSQKQVIKFKPINQKMVHFDFTLIPIRNKNIVDGIYLIISNITEVVELQQELCVSKSHQHVVQKIAEIGSFEYLIEEDKLFCSDNFFNIFGVEKAEFINLNTPFQFIHPHDYNVVFEKVSDAITFGRNFSCEFRIVHGKDKDTKYLKVDAEVLIEDNQPHKIIGVIKDETYQIELEHKLAELNENSEQIFDNLLSGIWIREKLGGKFLFASKGLEKILEIPINELYKDSTIWHSMINPTFHQELESNNEKLKNGEVIKTIYSLLSGIGKTKWVLEQVIPRIDDLGEVTNIFGVVTDVTIEMENIVNSTHLFEEDDNYQRSNHVNDDLTYKKYVLDRDMEMAITNEEFELYFQPQVSPKNGEICAAEALIRWNHKDLGMLLPGEFIPLAEENQKINPITDWVIQKTFSFIRDWMDKGLKVRPISINIPPIRFVKLGLLEYVSQQLDFYNIPAHYIEFEITEESILKDNEIVMETISGLKKLGIRFAMDDFGTGYASLDSLCLLKPNTIKIDQTFINHIEDEYGIEKGMITSIIDFSKSINMRVVAEGVEKFGQLKYLKEMECDHIQGYIYSKPVKVKTFENLLEQGYLNVDNSYSETGIL